MNSSRLSLFIYLVFFVAFFHSSLSYAENDWFVQPYSQTEVEKVFKLIAQIQNEQSEPNEGNLRQVTVTEDELNSYIAYRIEVERSEIMKELRLKLFKKNKIEGKIYIDLRGQELPDLLRPEMNLYFSGILETKENRVRLDLKSLYLEDQAIQPMVLDAVIYFGSKIQGMEPFSMSDWFELPYGIKDVETDKGRAVFYY